jgi:peptide deformylase
VIQFNLTLAPDPIFRQVAMPVNAVNDKVRTHIDAMFETLYREQGVGLGANMVGLLERIIVVDLQEGGVRTPLAIVNPHLVEVSDETQVFEEASLSFPGISAKIMRPASIKVTYLDREGKSRCIEAKGFLAQVIQHEMDYLDGRTFLDHLSPVKRKMLLKKYEKTKRIQSK